MLVSNFTFFLLFPTLIVGLVELYRTDENSIYQFTALLLAFVLGAFLLGVIYVAKPANYLLLTL